LSPTRKSTQKRHWQQPLIKVGVRERFREYLKWWPESGYTERTVLVTRLAQDSYLVKQPASWLNLRSNRPARRFFRLQGKRLRAAAIDLKRILLGSPRKQSTITSRNIQNQPPELNIHNSTMCFSTCFRNINRIL